MLKLLHRLDSATGKKDQETILLINKHFHVTMKLLIIFQKKKNPGRTVKILNTLWRKWKVGRSNKISGTICNLAIRLNKIKILTFGGRLSVIQLLHLQAEYNPDISLAENHWDRFVSSCRHTGQISGKWYTVMVKETGFSKGKVVKMLYLNGVFMN